MHFLLQLMARLRQVRLLQLFTVYLRYLIGGGFVIAAIGMGKLSGGVYMLSADAKPIGELEPIQQFFRVMTDSGLYWQFIGWTQVVGGFLLMTQRFAKLGALIFFGLILNIFVITVSYEFRGTPIVTGLMLLATAYLILWTSIPSNTLSANRVNKTSPRPLVLRSVTNLFGVCWGWYCLALLSE